MYKTWFGSWEADGQPRFRVIGHKRRVIPTVQQSLDAPSQLKKQPNKPPACPPRSFQDAFPEWTVEREFPSCPNLTMPSVLGPKTNLAPDIERRSGVYPVEMWQLPLPQHMGPAAPVRQLALPARLLQG